MLPPAKNIVIEELFKPKARHTPKRPGDRHRPGYYAEYMRKRRAAAKEKP